MMTAQTARNAYARPDAPARNPRAVEYDLFARVTRDLTEAWARRKADHKGLVRALYHNGRMWQTLAADLAEPGNALPQDLKARLFYLHEFTAHHSALVLDGSAGADALIEVNTAVMRGLRGDRGAAA